MSFDVDKITLECFVNKQTYQKYLAKINPQDYLKQQEMKREIETHREELMQRFQNYLDGKEFETSSIKNAFSEFTKECVLLIERESEADVEEKILPDEDDVIFSNIPKEDELEPKDSIPKDSIEYWKMQKVFKQSF
jgi:hypothetical protein